MSSRFFHTACICLILLSSNSYEAVLPTVRDSTVSETSNSTPIPTHGSNQISDTVSKTKTSDGMPILKTQPMKIRNVTWTLTVKSPLFNFNISGSRNGGRHSPKNDEANFDETDLDQSSGEGENEFGEHLVRNTFHSLELETNKLVKSGSGFSHTSSLPFQTTSQSTVLEKAKSASVSTTHSKLDTTTVNLLKFSGDINMLGEQILTNSSDQSTRRTVHSEVSTTVKNTEISEDTSQEMMDPAADQFGSKDIKEANKSSLNWLTTTTGSSETEYVGTSQLSQTMALDGIEVPTYTVATDQTQNHFFDTASETASVKFNDDLKITASEVFTSRSFSSDFKSFEESDLSENATSLTSISPDPTGGNEVSEEASTQEATEGTISGTKIPECPPPGMCIFWFMAQDACAVDSHCLGSRICCKIRCSKTCIDT